MGSSPLTRGKCSDGLSSPARQGLIPAHAGKIDTIKSNGFRLTAHPRSRGENAFVVAYNKSETGSSPLTRGKFGDHGLNRVPDGLIPAHAGKMKSTSRIHVRRTAHPRSRGENLWQDWHVRTREGSSPLTRGKFDLYTDEYVDQRLIPAHAGKMRACDPWPRSPRAHPRSRGENRIVVIALSLTAGSSPLTRGKFRAEDQRSGGEGLIPAHAGKINPRGEAEFENRAHPRSRGENANFLGSVVSSPGSSPLTRGKLSEIRHDLREVGLIPAHAGKIRGQERATQWVRAHPRSRGENTS